METPSHPDGTEESLEEMGTRHVDEDARQLTEEFRETPTEF